MSVSLYATLEVRLKGYQEEMAQLNAIVKYHPWRKWYCQRTIDKLQGRIDELQDILLMIKSTGKKN